MLILALESSAKAASAALCRDGALLAQTVQCSGLTHSRTLLPMAEDLIKNAGAALSEIDLFAVAHGPGSFTGVRIGVSTAKGLAWAAQKPAVGVSTLEAMAWHGLAAGERALICPVMDARRGQVYCAAFDMAAGMPKRALADAALPLADFLATLPTDRRLVFVGDGVPAYGMGVREALGDRALIAPANLRDLRADAACLLAAAKPDTWVPAAQLQPIYLRAPQAVRERERREKEAR